MTISSTNNFLNATYSNISKRENTDTINDSFKVYEEKETEITAFTKKVEGDYSTYSAEELSDLSYDEIKKNYDEIKEELEYRMLQAKDTMKSDSFKNYQKRLLFNDAHRRDRGIELSSYMDELSLFLREEDITDENDITDNMLDNKYGQITKENKELQNLLNFNDKFKIVNFFDNDEINETIYSNYEDNSQVYYEEISRSNGVHSHILGDTISLQGTDLEEILQAIKNEKKYRGDEKFTSVSDPKYDVSKGFYILSNEEILIAGKVFNINDVNKNEYKDLKKEDTKETEGVNSNTEATTETSEIENEKPDYSTYSAKQLRQLSFDEVKENYKELEKILENSLKTLNDLNKDEADDLLAFQAQLEKVNYLDNEELNKTIYNKLKDINDSKVAVWSSLAITENINNLQEGTVNSIVIDNTAIFPDDIKINEKEETQNNQEEDKDISNNQTIDKSQVNLDSIIRTVSKISQDADQTSQDTYKQELIEAYSDFISEYNKIKSSLLT